MNSRQIYPVNRNMIRKAASSLRSAAKKVRNYIFNYIDTPVIVLIYHRVTLLSEDPQMLSVSPQNFRAQMRHLKENYFLTRFEDDWTKINTPAVAVTFDDGYADNVREALPILEELGVPATFFISSGLINSRKEFWSDELERIILNTSDLPSIFTGADLDNNLKMPTSTEDDLWQFYLYMLRRLKSLDVPERERWILLLRTWARVGEEGRETHLAMTDKQVRCLAASRLVTIGAHSKTHTALSILPLTRQEEEIFGSQKKLEDLTGGEILVFSYPYGSKHDYTLESRNLCKKAGYVKTAANIPGQVHRWTDPHQIPRHLVRNWPVDIFARQVKEFMLK